MIGEIYVEFADGTKLGPSRKISSVPKAKDGWLFYISDQGAEVHINLDKVALWRFRRGSGAAV